MYKKGTAVEIQFSPERLNDGAGDPYWIDLSRDEALALHRALEQYLAAHPDGSAAPVAVVSLDAGERAAIGQAARPETAVRPEARATPDAFKQWVCVICGWVYDEAAGLPDEGIAPGTRWADIPEDWRCPLCDVGKTDFALVEF